MLRSIVAGAIAGAAGELALNIVTYGDMLVRGRPASEMPATVARRMAETVGIGPSQRPLRAANRHEAAGALLGYGMAVGMAVGYAILRRFGIRPSVPVAGLALGGGAMAISDTTAIALGATDPAEWGVSGWVADIVPHAVYGIVTAATLERIDP